MFYVTSTYSISLALRRTLGGLQTDLARSQKEFTTGRQADLGVALGAHAARSFALGGARDTIEATRATNNIVSARLESTQTSLTTLLANAKAMRATLLSAQTDGGEPGAIVAQGRNALANFISTLNGGDGDSFLFGGINNGVAPVTDYFAQPPAANKLALDAAFLSSFGFAQGDPAVASLTTTQVNDFLNGPFQSLFTPGSWATTWSRASDEPQRSQISMSLTIDSSITANEPALQKLAAAYTMTSDLGAANMNRETYKVVLQTARQTIDDAIDSLTRAQARVGVMQGTINATNETMSIQSNTLLIQLGDLEGVDQTEAAARVNNLMTQIESAFTLTSRINQLSLTKFL